MATRPTDDIELDDINRVDDVIREGQEEESSFTEDNRPGDESMIIIDTSIPNVRLGDIRRALTQDKKDFLKRELCVKINKSDAPKLFNYLTLTERGAKYKGVDVLVTQDGIIGYNSEPSAQRAVNEFKGLIEKAKERYSSSAVGYVDKQAAKQIGEEPSNVDKETAEEVIDRVFERLQDEIDERASSVEVGLSGNELRKFRGILRAEKIDFLDIEIQHWKDLSKNESSEVKKKLYESIAEVAELKADELRLRENQIRKSDGVKEIIEEEIRTNDLTRFQRFRKWARENLAGLAAVAISIGGIITTIVAGARKAVRLGAKGVSSFAKAVVAVGKKLGPVIGAVLKLVGNVLSLGAKGISFLANNLWLLAVLFASYVVYNKREWLTKRK